MTYRAKRSVVYVVGAGSSDTSTLISVLINNNNNNNNNNNDNNNNADDSGTSSSSSSHPNNDRVPSPSSSSTSSSSLSSSSSSSTSQSGIVVHEWTPTQQSTNTDGDKEEEDGVTLQVWDFNGSKAHRQVQAVTTRPPCLVIVLLGVDQGDYGSSITHLTQVLNALQAKCPGSYVIVALSQPTTTTTTTINNNNDNDNNNNGDNKESSRRLDEIQTAVTDWGRQWTQNVEREILDIECDLQIAANNEVTNQTETSENESKPTLKEITHKHTGCLQTHLTTHLLQIHDTVLTVSTSDGQGIPELRKTVIEKATCHQLFPHLTRGVQDEISKVIEYIQDAKDAGKIMVPLGDVDDVIQQRSEEKEKPRDEVMGIYQQLQELGYILLLAQPPTKDLNPAKDTADRTATHPTRANPFFPAQFVCVNPEAFANMILGCLIEDGKKTYKLEANRFWPRDSGFKPPDPDLLARVLEILPQEGCVREAVLPILWQDYAHDQHQILHTLRCLQALGVLVFYEKSVQDCAGLAMPSYTLLSAQNTHASVLMDMIPKKKPQLNWTSKPFKDDLQVTWRMSGVTCLPTTVVRRCLAHTKSFFEPLCDYIHIWDEGVLIKFEDATIYVESVKNGNSIHVSCRVNADDADKDKTIRELWVHLATAVKVEMDFLAWQLPGVVFQTKIAIFGSVFFTARPSDSELEISLVKSLTSWRFGGHVTAYEGMIEHKIKLDVLFPFEDDTVWTPRDWIDLVLAKAQQLDMSISDRESREKLRSYRKKKNKLYRNKPSRKNRGVEVKWKAEVEEVDTKQDGGNSNAANPSPNSVSDNDVTSNTTSGDSDTPTTTQHATLTKEEWSRKASELACQFVSCTLALAVADLVALKSQSLQGKHTDAQVTAARVTANAALAVHTGDLDAAAKAVIEAVHAAQGNPGRKGKPTSQLGGHESRLCTIL